MQDVSSENFKRLRDAQRLRREIALRLNLKESTIGPRMVKDRQQRMLDKELTEANGSVICKYPMWLERRMLGFKLWKGQFFAQRRRRNDD